MYAKEATRGKLGGQFIGESCHFLKIKREFHFETGDLRGLSFMVESWHFLVKQVLFHFESGHAEWQARLRAGFWWGGGSKDRQKEVQDWEVT